MQILEFRQHELNFKPQHVNQKGIELGEQKFNFR